MKKIKFSKNRVTDGGNEEQKESIFTKKNIALFIVGGLVLLMVLSIFAVSLGNDSSFASTKVNYKGYTFINNEGLLSIKLNGVDYNFDYIPADLENIKVNNLGSVSFSDKVYIAFNPKEFSEDSIEIVKLRQFFYYKGVSASPACTIEEGCGDIPIIDCNNVNNALYFLNGNKTEIYKEGNCIVLESKLGEEQMIINRFMYFVLGIMSE